MKHFVHRMCNRLLVCHMIPGTNVASVDSDYPLGCANAALTEAERNTAPVHIEVPPEERKIASGFYADQGHLF